MGRYGGYRHGPVLLRLQRSCLAAALAVLVMTLLLVMVFIIPIALLVNSIVDGSGPLIKSHFQRRHDVTRSGVA